MNAMTHGLTTAKDHIAFWEEKEAFQSMRDALVAEMAPVGIIETDYVDRIAILLFRSIRIELMETGVLNHAFVNANRIGRLIPDKQPAADSSGTETNTVSQLEKSFVTQIGHAVAYAMSEGKALEKIDGFRCHNHRMLRELLKDFHVVQARRRDEEGSHDGA